jgi:hypothetical protein
MGDLAGAERNHMGGLSDPTRRLLPQEDVGTPVAPETHLGSHQDHNVFGWQMRRRIHGDVGDVAGLRTLVFPLRRTMFLLVVGLL